MTGFKRINTTDVKTVKVMEHCGKNTSSGYFGKMVLTADLTPTITGSTVVSAATFTKVPAIETNNGTMYGAFSSSGTTRTVTLYSDSSRTNVVATGSATIANGNSSSVTLTAASGCNTTGTCTVTIPGGGASDEPSITLAFGLSATKMTSYSTYTNTGITLTGDLSNCTYGGNRIDTNSLVGAWAIIRGEEHGWIIDQISANNQWYSQSSNGCTITLTNTTLTSTTLGFGTHQLVLYIVEKPAFGRQSLVGTYYGPRYMTSATSGVITEGFAATNPMVANEFQNKYVQFLSGPWRGNCYKIYSNTTTTITLSSVIDASELNYTYNAAHPSWGWFIIIDMVSAKTATSTFSLQLKSKVEGSDDVSGLSNTGGFVGTYEGVFSTGDKTRKYAFAASGGEFRDSSYNPHHVPILPSKFNGGSAPASTDRYLEDGFRTALVPNRVPSELTNGMDGWPIANSPVNDTTHFIFMVEVYTEKMNNKYETMIMKDCTLEITDYGYTFENDPKPLEAKFNIKCSASEVY